MLIWQEIWILNGFKHGKKIDYITGGWTHKLDKTSNKHTQGAELM